MANPCYLSQIAEKDPQFSNEEVRAIWKLAKDNYIDKGRDYNATIKGISRDLAIPERWVERAFTEPKTIRSVSREMFQKMHDRREALNNAKESIRSIDTPGWRKFLSAAVKLPFSLKVGYHGQVGMQTHAGAVLFRPTEWSNYANNFIRQFKFIDKATYEQAMKRMERSDNFLEAQKNGLATDPAKQYTDYEMLGKILGTEMGKRGFAALKTMRQDMFDGAWEKVSNEIKNDPEQRAEMIKNLSTDINSATGVADIGHGPLAKGANFALFAAKLQMSRWKRVLGDPLQTIGTAIDWKNASPAARVQAWTRTKNAIEFVSVYTATLLANQALLKYAGSKNNINFSDPSKPDWMAHKTGDQYLRLEGRLLTPVRLLAMLAQISWNDLSKKNISMHETRTDLASDKISKYLRSQEAPTLQLASEIYSQTDSQGRPVPWAREEGTPDKPKYTTAEYLLKQGPIPLEGFTGELYKGFREQGMSASQTTALMKGLRTLGEEIIGIGTGTPSEAYAEEQGKPAKQLRKTAR